MLRPGKPAYSAEHERAVEMAAKKIGIDLMKEPYLRWIAEYARNPELPDDWAEFRDDHGELAYYNPKTKMLSRTHPVLDKFEDFVCQQRGFMEARDYSMLYLGVTLCRRQGDANTTLATEAEVEALLARDWSQLIAGAAGD